MQITPRSNGINNKLFNYKKGGMEQGIVQPKKYLQSDISIPNETPDESNLSEYPIKLNKVSASWTAEENSADMTLKNISMRIRKGKLCAVIGPVGSGKVRFLYLLLV